MQIRSALLMLILCFSQVIRAQEGSATCPAVVEQALTAVGETCTDIDRNSACYGYNQVRAEFANPVAEEFFSEPSETAPLLEMLSLQTGPLDIVAQTWGIAVMNVQANVPGTLPGQAVTFILLGNTTVENAVAPEDAVISSGSVEVVVVSAQRVNLRSGPATTFKVVGNAGPRDLLTADGVNEGRDWVRVTLGSGAAWISRTLIDFSNANADAFAALPVVTGSEALTPMQAFYFSTGIGVPGCVEAQDLLVIQGPRDVQVNLTVNGAEITLGSTAVLFSEVSDYGTLLAFDVFTEQLQEQTLADDTECRHTRMVVMDGAAELGSGDTLPLGHFGEQVTCVDAESAPVFVSAWDKIRRLSQDELALFSIVESVPASILSYPITVPSDDEIDDALAEPTPFPTQVRPAATSRPAATAVPGQPTAVRPQPSSTPSSADPCQGFRATSPFGPVPFGTQDFYWDPVTNAATGITAYQLDINAYDANGTLVSERLYRVGANTTGVPVNIAADFPDLTTNITWFVQALSGSEGAYQTPCQSVSTNIPVSR